ncbi:hypothetical protein Tsubulata_041738 [Turnera subulata]|uniref:Uncharacterized protein n=1 Tax=Turnera subulata TaxID=218843 RepID=A0A9Q0GFI2_9ROSI|nr:hypothetical protein Tsubulata_041738 [Turnera subulata]
MGPLGIFYVLVLPLWMVVPSLATIHTVGDNSGWTLGTHDHSTWKSDNTFAAAGDRLGGVKLFVFGASWADTGNYEAVKRPGEPFSYPLGMTWPGKPAGRLSDGYVLTDVIALFFNTTAPPTYSQWQKNSVAESELKNGMNFAFGGSGALPTWENVTLRVQLGQFKQVVEDMVFTPNDLKDSVAVLSFVANDYNFYLAMNNRSRVVSFLTWYGGILIISIMNYGF